VAALVATGAFAILGPAAAVGAANPGGAASPVDTSQAGGAAPTAPPARAPTSKTKATRSSAPVIVHVKCVPASACNANPHEVSVEGRLAFTGTGLGAGETVVWPTARGAHAARAPVSSLHSSSFGLVVAVPRAAHSGKVYVIARGTRSKSYGPITIVTYKLHPPAPPRTTTTTPVPASVTPTNTAFNGQGMWIWYVSQSDGGNLTNIIAEAHAAGITTLYIKSSDGASNFWSQFNPSLVATLHANGLKVCAWQYVYGTNPVGEADLGAEAVADGADCLVIDAEVEYQGKYAAAQEYIDTLRAKIGPSYPLGLASFPYVYDHETFPYSVFLGPGGAQFNAPQMYWHDIGVSVDTVYANTYIANRIYGRPIFPLGQTYGGASASDILRFREEAVDYGAGGWSFWDWQSSPAYAWTALADPLAPLTSVVPNATWPDLGKGSEGDQVLWMQEHLAALYPSQPTSGIFDATTLADLEAFQLAHGVPVTGQTSAATWEALLQVNPITVQWSSGGVPSGGGSTTTGTATSTTSTASLTTGTLTTSPAGGAEAG